MSTPPDDRVASVAAFEADLRAALKHVERWREPDRWDGLMVRVAIDHLRRADAPIPTDLQERLHALGHRE